LKAGKARQGTKGSQGRKIEQTKHGVQAHRDRRQASQEGEGEKSGWEKGMKGRQGRKIGQAKQGVHGRIARQTGEEGSQVR